MATKDTMDKLIDLDAIFSEFLSEWFQDHKSDYEDFGELEEAAAGVYGKWADKPLDVLGGVPPIEYYKRMSDPKQLVALSVKYVMSDMSPPVLLCDRIAEVKECEPYLAQIVELNESAELTITAANILTEMQSEAAFPTYVDWLFGKTKSEELLELAVEKLSAGIKSIAETILSRMESQPLDMKAAKYIADVLMNYNKDERIYNLLVTLFENGGDVPLYAAYLGKYGDSRALPLLVSKGESRDINYLEYMEIRNAVEALGGELVNNKDFTNDKYYKALKGL